MLKLRKLQFYHVNHTRRTTFDREFTADGGRDSPPDRRGMEMVREISKILGMIQPYEHLNGRTLICTGLVRKQVTMH